MIIDLTVASISCPNDLSKMDPARASLVILGNRGMRARDRAYETQILSSREQFWFHQPLSTARSTLSPRSLSSSIASCSSRSEEGRAKGPEAPRDWADKSAIKKANKETFFSLLCRSDSRGELGTEKNGKKVGTNEIMGDNNWNQDY